MLDRLLRDVNFTCMVTFQSPRIVGNGIVEVGKPCRWEYKKVSFDDDQHEVSNRYNGLLTSIAHTILNPDAKSRLY